MRRQVGRVSRADGFTAGLVMLLAVVLGGGAGVAQAQPAYPRGWGDECVDCPRSFEGNASLRALQVDTTGQPHIVYGGDHLYYAWRGASGWQYETVDGARGVGRGATLALDRDNTPHMLYCDTNGTQVKYARRTAGGWSLAVVPAVTGECEAALAVDGDGRPHIAVGVPGVPGAGSVRYGVLDGGIWRFEQVAAIPAEVAVDLALDASGRPHIAYMTGENGKTVVKYATRGSSNWNSTAAITPYDYGWITNVMLALDGTGRAHITYERYTGGAIHSTALQYVHEVQGGWQEETLAPGASMGAIAVGADGHPHVAYTAGDAIYAFWDGAAWVKEVAAGSSVQPDGAPSLALGTGGRPHLAYIGATLAYFAHTEAGWEPEVVDRSEAAGFGNALALDAAGGPHIAYQRVETKPTGGLSQLMYVQPGSGGWEAQTVYSVTADALGTGVADSLDLALDRAGNPHIGFVTGEFNARTLRYAAWGGGKWTVEAVDTFAGTGQVALALDAADQPRLAYGANELRYAHRQDGQWVVQTVAAAAQSFDIRAASLALGNGDRPSISFYDTYMLRLARWNGAAWEIGKVADTNGILSRADLVLDAAGNPQIAYCGTLDRLQVARLAGGDWEIQPVGPAQELQTCYGVSLALDGDGHPHMSYVLASAPTALENYGELMYAEWRGGRWEIERVKSTGNPDLNNDYGASLALDAAGMAHISSYDLVTRDLYYSHLLDCGRVTCRYGYLPRIGRDVSGHGE